jgi:hypothetical protein
LWTRTWDTPIFHRHLQLEGAEDKRLNPVKYPPAGGFHPKEIKDFIGQAGQENEKLKN